MTDDDPYDPEVAGSRVRLPAVALVGIAIAVLTIIVIVLAALVALGRQ